jgi:hypothetical protein
VDAAGATASIEDAGGSVTTADDSDAVDTVDDGVSELVEADSELKVTTLGGPTAAVTSARAGTTCLAIAKADPLTADSLPRSRSSSCLFPCFVPFAYALLDLRCPFPPSPSAAPTWPKSRPRSNRGRSENR